MTWNSTFTKPAKPLQRKTPMRQAKPMARSARTKIAKVSAVALEPADEEASVWLKAMKSRGMKGRSATSEQRYFHGLLADVVGCIACRQDGMFTSYVSIHHIDGRTKPDAHWLVLPLCGPHHQDMSVDGVIPVHPYKARFEAAYGAQRELLKKSIQILLDGGFVVPAAALTAAGMQKDCPASVPADLGAAHNALEV